jgi:uncharacterized protein YbjT (DUF2867 family)
MKSDKEVLIFGATGNIGGATLKEMLKRGWKVRAVTRNPESEKALALMDLGAHVIRADMEQRSSLETAFQGVRHVLSVQNWTLSGVEDEARQGKLVAEVAKQAGVEHLVNISAGTGQADTDIPHFDSKLEVEATMRTLGLPFTIIRPGPVMELMTDQQFFPPVAIWGVAPKIMGWDTPKPWVTVEDIGIAAANAFDHPEQWIGKDVHLIGDVKSLGECRQAMRASLGKNPFRLPLPLWLFRRIAAEEFELMWRWVVQLVKEKGRSWFEAEMQAARKINPDLQTVEQWLNHQKRSRALRGA